MGPIRLTNYNFHAHVQYCITIHYHSCSIDKYRNVEGPKCQFWKVRNILFWEQRVLQNSPQKLGVSPIFLLPPKLIWGSPSPRGMRYHLPFMGPIRLTNYYFHAHVQHCITIHYHSCSIDTYRNVEGPKCHNFGRDVWDEVNRTQVSTTLGHQMLLLVVPLSSGQLDPS